MEVRAFGPRGSEPLPAQVPRVTFIGMADDPTSGKPSAANAMGDETDARSKTRDWGRLEQIRRARRLLDLAEAQSADRDSRFLTLLGALHLSRAIVEHWYTIADLIPARLNKKGKEADVLTKKLREQFETVFARGRRYALVTDLRDWDFHWRPLTNPETVGPGITLGQGAPMILSTGSNPKSGAVLRGDTMEVITWGSGKRVGRTNYVRIKGQRFVDFEASELISLKLALEQFLADLPSLIAEVAEIAEVKAYFATM